jgi:hypothetical protein
MNSATIASRAQNRSGLVVVTGQVTRHFMKRILILLCLALVLFQAGCAIGPPIDQQTLEQQNRAQSEKKADTFARGLAQ